MNERNMKAARNNTHYYPVKEYMSFAALMDQWVSANAISTLSSKTVKCNTQSAFIDNCTNDKFYNCPLSLKCL